MRKRFTLTRAIFLAILGAVALGLVAPDWAQVLKPIGDAFLSLLKMLIAPVIFFSITAGIASFPKLGQLRRMGLATLVYFLTTPIIAIATGLVVVHWLHPGLHADPTLLQGLAGLPASARGAAMATVGIADLGKGFIDDLFMNPFRAMAETKILALSLFAIVFGIAIQVLRPKTERLAELCTEANIVFMTLLHWIMWLAPIGLFCLVAAMVANLGIEAFRALGWFVLTVLIATFWHGFVNLFLILRWVGKRRVWPTLKAMLDPLLVAFSTSSSNATLPVTIDTAVNKLKVSEAAAKLVVPIGATVNMDGTALYEAIAAIFIAEIYGIPLSFGSELVIFVMAMVTAIGAPGIPSAGMVTMILVLQAVGLPIEGIGLLLIVDRLLDAFRTMVNVEGDLIGACIVDRFGKQEGTSKNYPSAALDSKISRSTYI